MVHHPQEGVEARSCTHAPQACPILPTCTRLMVYPWFTRITQLGAPTPTTKDSLCTAVLVDSMRALPQVQAAIYKPSCGTLCRNTIPSAAIPFHGCHALFPWAQQARRPRLLCNWRTVRQSVAPSSFQIAELPTLSPGNEDHRALLCSR